MDATLHEIQGREDAAKIGPRRLDSFALGPATAVSPQMVVEQPGWSIYYLDVPERIAAFVELPPESDVADASFMHIRQFHEARRVALVPFAALEEISRKVRQPERLVCIYSIGRCGTTLAHWMLDRVQEVWALSEPSAHFDLAMKRAELGRAELESLAGSITRLLFRPPAGRRLPTTMAIKFHSQVLFVADAIHAAFPDAINVFMYRDALGWGNSVYQFMQRLGMPRTLDKETRDFAWWINTGAADPAYLRPFVDMEGETVYPDQLLAPSWALHLEAYLKLHRSGMPFLALRYNELNADREAEAARLLRHCGLPVGEVAEVLRAFDADSQEGTEIARDRPAVPFTAGEKARYLATLAMHPRIKSPDLLLPDLYHPERVVDATR